MTTRTTTVRTATTTAVRRTNTPPPPIILQLRLPEERMQPTPPAVTGTEATHHTVTWDSGIVDNEGMNRRKSKKCCIFHKQRPFDESDSESDDDSDGGWEIGENGVPVWVPGHHAMDDHNSCNCDHDE